MKQQLNQELLVLCENLVSNSCKLLGVKVVLIEEKENINNNTLSIILGGSTYLSEACWFYLHCYSHP